MLSRYNFTSQASTVKRLGAYASDKATYATVSGFTPLGFFTPITPFNATDQIEIVDQGYQFITDGPTDIRANDQLTIDGAVYGVKGIQRNRQLSQDILTVTLTKIITN